MTNTEVIKFSDAREQDTRPQSWEDIAVSLAAQIAETGRNRREDLAGLKRMDPDEPDAAAYWRLMAHNELLNGDEAFERKWALIIHGIALMTPTNRSNNNPRTAHDGHMPVGRALFLGDETREMYGFYREVRLNQTLTARGPMLRNLLTRMFRMLGTAGVTFNWREMARFILNEDHDEEAAEQDRRQIAQDYYQAERRRSIQLEDRGE